MLEARTVSFGYGASGPPVLEGCSLALGPGEIVGLAGASGAGKSTLGRILAGFLKPRSGAVVLDGRPLPDCGLSPVQMLFQTPELAVNPRWTIRRILTEAHEASGDLLRAFGVRQDWFDRYPHELSGGELQRIAIVRALDERVRFLIADEVSGMLDPIAQAEIWRALLELAARRGIGMLVITHDEHLARRVAGRRVELRSGRILASRPIIEAAPAEAATGPTRRRVVAQPE
jgi:ABC-type dipeptide/oligopeptide/nickel transport system ATPase subunit